MRFGFFDQLPCAPGYSEPQRYKDIIAQIELGDAVGFDTVWLGEIHFIREFSILADPLMVLAAAAQRTSRIRLGTAVTLLPLHSPIKIAEEAAIADILSDGRLEFGVGRGIARHYPSYGIPPEESLLFGDHAMFFRRADFLAVGGCDPTLLVMEEADLCIRFHRLGRTRLVNRVVITSDRRVAAWGALRANWIYLKVGARWGLGFRKGLERHYPDVR